MFDLDAMDQAERKLRELAPELDCAQPPTPAEAAAVAVPRGCPFQQGGAVP